MKIKMEEELWSRWKVEQSETVEFLRRYKWENFKNLYRESNENLKKKNDQRRWKIELRRQQLKKMKSWTK